MNAEPSQGPAWYWSDVRNSTEVRQAQDTLCNNEHSVCVCIYIYTHTRIQTNKQTHYTNYLSIYPSTYLYIYIYTYVCIQIQNTYY